VHDIHVNNDRTKSKNIQITSVKNVHATTAVMMLLLLLLLLYFFIVIIIIIIIIMLYIEFRRGFSYAQTFFVGLRNAHNNHRAFYCVFP